MSAILNQRQPGTLPKNTVENLKNDGQVFAITTRNVMSTLDPPLPAVEVPRHDEAVVDKTPIMESEKAIGGDDTVVNKRGKRTVVD